MEFLLAIVAVVYVLIAFVLVALCRAAATGDAAMLREPAAPADVLGHPAVTPRHQRAV